jgi:hypothetical protein
MSVMKMRGWRRLGVVLSVLWFIGFGWWLRQADYDNAMKFAGYDMCSYAYERKRAREFSDLEQALREDAQVNREFHDCLHRAGEDFVRLITPWWVIIVMDVLSIALMWLLAWIIVRVGRWVAVGFRT